MEVRIIIAGSRTFADYDLLKANMDAYIRRVPTYNPITFISGCSKGADELGERYAAEHGFEVLRCPADWRIYGKAAGPIRNEIMAYMATETDCCGVLFAFWDGNSRGTASMIREAKKHNLEIHIVKIPS